MTTTTKLEVKGMTCGNCVRHVTDALREVTGVSRVDVDLVAGRATVEHEGVELAKLVAALDDAGYDGAAAG